MVEFNLSEKRTEINDPGIVMKPLWVYEEEHVREAIQRLKSPSNTMAARGEDGSKMILISYDEIDKIFGEELTNG